MKKTIFRAVAAALLAAMCTSCSPQSDEPVSTSQNAAGQTAPVQTETAQTVAPSASLAPSETPTTEAAVENADTPYASLAPSETSTAIVAPSLPTSGIKVGEAITFGDYEWLVLDVQADKTLIITKDIIDMRMYNEIWEDVTWKSCTLRKWLNSDFVGSFSQSEQQRIQETTAIAADNPWFGTAGGENTLDKVFLLSVEEVVDYFGDSGFLRSGSSDNSNFSDQYNTARGAVLTITEAQMEDAAQRLVENPEMGSLFTPENALAEIRKQSDGGTYQWLRTSGEDARCAAYISVDGAVFINGYNVNAFNGGVRPAMWVK